MASIQCKIDLTGKIRLVGNTRIESVTQLIGGGLGIVFIEVGAHNVDVGRKIASRMSFGVLLVGPLDLKISAFLIIGGTFRTYLVDSEAQSHRAIETVTFVVAERRLDAP